MTAMPHGEIKEVFPNIYFVTGTSRPTFFGSTWQFSRNMTILRDGDDLTLVNTVRLDDGGLAELDRLGKVKNVVRLGAFHGMDDAFYIDRYHAKLWALAGMEHENDKKTDVELVPGGKMPVADASLFVFETSAKPEGLLVIDREGGVVISCDSLQNWAACDQYFDEASTERMKQMGFIQPANIGPGWRGACKPEAKDFARLKALRFRHLLPAHGTPIRGEAHEQLCATFAREYSV